MAEPMRIDDAGHGRWPRRRRAVVRLHGILLPDALYERLLLGACRRGITANEYAAAILEAELGDRAATAGEAA
jgi:hypothetical protein